VVGLQPQDAARQPHREAVRRDRHEDTGPFEIGHLRDRLRQRGGLVERPDAEDRRRAAV
jgi:hypothetical protein